MLRETKRYDTIRWTQLIKLQLDGEMNILLTGRPGIGKTTAIQRIVERLGVDRVGGFWSQEIREQGFRTGFFIHTVDGMKGILASTKTLNGPRVGKYTVSLKDIETVAVSSLERARINGKIIIIDEIASMELKSTLFAPEVRRCLDEGRVIGTLQARSGGFQNEVRNRPDVRIIEINLENRDSIPAQVANSL